MFGKGNGPDVDLAETEPWENNGNGDYTLEPESGVVLTSVVEGHAGVATVVDEENNLGPDQSHSGPPKETVSPLEVIVEFTTHVGVGKYNHHQE